ncbi:MAG: DUF1700 domain-containing protein [Oligoflexia bacterium]|nr:DUF1700 domain-containing protein [Oligoflexia bacterium]
MVTNSSKLEGYLTILEKALGPISVSEKAEIITEIKSHVLEAQERDGTQSIDSILSSLGEPEQVASRYLLERGLKLQKPPKHPVIKWLVLGFLGTVSIVMLFVVILIWKFTPIFKVDGNTGKVTIMGGLIDIDNTFNFKEVKFSDSRKIKKKIKNVTINFSNGSFEFANSDDNTFSWECVGSDKYNSDNYVEENGDTIVLNLNKPVATRCDIKVPAGILLRAEGSNGKIGLIRPEYNVDLKINNGMVGIRPDDGVKYKYDITYVNGWADTFKSSQSKDAYSLKISLVNGNIKRF